MTDSELSLLKASIDQVVVLTTAEGERAAQILFVFDEGDTPDLFYLEVERQADGTFAQKGSGGYSLLLDEVVAVRPLPLL